MSEKWAEGDKVIVSRQGIDLSGFVNLVDKKNGMIHVHTDRGPVTLLSTSTALRRLENKDDSTKTL